MLAAALPSVLLVAVAAPSLLWHATAGLVVSLFGTAWVVLVTVTALLAFGSVVLATPRVLAAL